MEFVNSLTWCQEVAWINVVPRPERPLLPAQAVRPEGQDGTGMNGPRWAECVVNRDPGLTAWAG